MNMQWIGFILLPLVLGLAACAGTQTFTPVARAGDTVALTVGWQKDLQRKIKAIGGIWDPDQQLWYAPEENARRAGLTDRIVR